MLEKLRFLFQTYWVEWVLVPPFVVGLCYLLYGDAYVHSWYNFGRMTFPWIFSSIVSPVACHWVRNTTLSHFTRLDDWPKRVIWSIIGYMIFTVGFAKVNYFVLSQMHYADLVPSVKNFYAVLIMTSMCVLIVAVFYEGVTYFGKWKEALTETEQLEKLNLETQFQSLQSQLNPHFLFNSLNVLSSLITESPRRAENFVDELSNVYRYLLRSNERELASVADELRFIHSFFHLLETRHDSAIVLEVHVSPGTRIKKLPALALQILLENAVKHNEISPEKPLQVEITDAKDGQPRLLVRNNRQQKVTRVSSNRVGLDNLRQRYELLGVAGFDVHEDGPYFTVILPLI